jgi:hypothetical protein
VFWIGFSDEPLVKMDPREKGKVGLLVLGDHKERFVVHLDTWTKGNYVDQWKRALKRVLNGEESALITDMHTPATSNHLVWWPMWKLGSEIVFHNQLLFFKKYKIFQDEIPQRQKRHTKVLSTANVEPLYKLIGQREYLSEDGMPLSEWRVPVNEIREFLNADVGVGYPSTAETSEPVVAWIEPAKLKQQI